MKVEHWLSTVWVEKRFIRNSEHRHKIRHTGNARHPTYAHYLYHHAQKPGLYRFLWSCYDSIIIQEHIKDFTFPHVFKVAQLHPQHNGACVLILDQVEPAMLFKLKFSEYLLEYKQ